AVQAVGRFSFLLSAQRAACTGATHSAFVLGWFNLLALAQRAVGQCCATRRVFGQG
ncbi:hypothetical protein A2U01_0077939, partial [Trifolium medium]|nr:hypothetical protein [Trifolium medium]